MPEENLPVWKQAAKDNQHPLHKATWLLFAEKFNVKFVAKQLADKKEETIEYIYLILDTDELYYEESFGSGYAPIHACKLLGHWQVTEAIPHLLRILIDYDFDDAEMVWDRAVSALETMGEVVVEPLIEAIENQKIKLNEVTFTLAKAGEGDERCFTLIQQEFEKTKDKWEISFLAEALLVCDADKATPYLQDCLQNFKYSKDIREVLRDYIEDAKEGNFP